VTSLLRKVTLDRKREIRILSVFNDVLDIVQSLEKRTAPARSHLEKVFFYNGLTQFWETRIPHRKRFPEYVRRPTLLTESFTVVSAALAALRHPCALRRAYGDLLVYGFLTSEFSFDEFRSLRSDLSAPDARVTQALAFPDAIIRRQIPPPAAPRRLDKHSWLALQVDRLRLREDLLDCARDACIESTPLRKLDRLGHALSVARAYFSQECPPAIELGADEFTPIMIVYLALANPPYLVSNLVYIIDFCYSEAFGALFETSIVQPAGTLRLLITEALPGFDLASVTRS
jgi:hypothetical protein